LPVTVSATATAAAAATIVATRARGDSVIARQRSLAEHRYIWESHADLS
jgi:hypothetical protein